MSSVTSVFLPLLPPLLQGSLSFDERDLRMASHNCLLGAPPTSAMTGCGSLYLSYLLQEEVSLMMAEYDTDL